MAPWTSPLLELVPEARLAGAGGTGDADQVRTPCMSENRTHQIGRRAILVLDEGNRARDRARIARQEPLGERGRHECDRSWRAMTRR